jgi:hypothetical protein
VKFEPCNISQVKKPYIQVHLVRNSSCDKIMAYRYPFNACPPLGQYFTPVSADHVLANENPNGDAQ